MGYDLTETFIGLLPEDVVFKLKEELTISEDIDSEVDEASARFGFFAVLSERAESRYQKIKTHFDVWEANTVTAYLRESELDGKKKPAKEAIDLFVRTQPKYFAYKDKLNKFDRERKILRQIALAFEKKANLIQTKSSNRRSELRTGS